MRQFVESMKRLYSNNRVLEDKIINLFQEGKITEDERDYILNT